MQTELDVTSTRTDWLKHVTMANKYLKIQTYFDINLRYETCLSSITDSTISRELFFQQTLLYGSKTWFCGSSDI